MNTPRSLAIIGGGQAAKAMLFAIVERMATGRSDWCGLEILVFERGEEFGTGLAWSRSQVLSEHLSSLASDQPRGDYGDGQLLQFSRCVEMLGELGVGVRLRPRCEAIRLALEGDRWKLSTSDDRHYVVDAVVLATGHARGLETRPPGVLWPWPATELQHVVTEGARTVLVLGTSLTGVDAALTLGLAAGAFEWRHDGNCRYQPHRAVRVILGSRSGCLPAVWGPRPRPWPEFERSFVAALDALVRRHNRLPLSQAFDVLSDLSAAMDGGLGDIERPNQTLVQRVRRLLALQRLRARHPMTTLRHDLDQARSVHALPELPRQRTLLAALPILSEVFPSLGTEDHALFEKLLRGPLYRHAMPMGQPTAQRLLAMMDVGALEVRRVSADAVCPAVGGWRVTDFAEQSFEVDQVVDALGPLYDVAHMDVAVLRHALHDGYVRPARRFSMATSQAVGLVGGVDVDPRSRRVRSEGRHPPLYAMGTLTLGLFLDAQAVGHLIRDAEGIAADLDRLRTGTTSEAVKVGGREP